MQEDNMQGDDERRGNLRHNLAEQVFVKNVAASDIVIYPDEPDLEGGSFATTVDVSHCGLRLYLEDSVLEGGTLALWVTLEEGSEQLLLTGTVKWSHRSGSGYLVGVKLDDNSQDDITAWQQLIDFKNAELPNN